MIQVPEAALRQIDAALRRTRARQAIEHARQLGVANVLWAVGGLGTLVFGIWLALYVKGYELWDGWILAAIALWAIATELGRRAQLGYGSIAGGSEGGVAAAEAEQAVLMHWLRSLVVLALMVVMIYKPGA